jgi:hypothetical protein
VTLKINQKLKNSGEELEKIDFTDDIPLTPSGGTLSTLQNSLDGPKAGGKRPEFDPLLKVIGENKKREIKHSARNQAFLGYRNGKWIGSWFLADGNSCIVKRSNAIL